MDDFKDMKTELHFRKRKNDENLKDGVLPSDERRTRSEMGRTLKSPLAWISAILEESLDALKINREEDTKYDEVMKTGKRRKCLNDDQDCRDVADASELAEYKNRAKALRRNLGELEERLEFVVHVLESFASVKNWAKAVDDVCQEVAATETWRAWNLDESFYEKNGDETTLHVGLDDLDLFVMADTSPTTTLTKTPPPIAAGSSDVHDDSNVSENDSGMECAISSDIMSCLPSIEIHSTQSSVVLPSSTSTSLSPCAPSHEVIDEDSPKPLGGPKKSITRKRTSLSAKSNSKNSTRRRRPLILPKRLKIANVKKNETVLTNSMDKDSAKAATPRKSSPQNVTGLDKDYDDKYLFVNQIVKQFLCQKCNQIFSRSDSYQRHIRSAHMRSDNKYVCVICGLSSRRLDNVKKHLKRVHDLESGKISVKDFIIVTPAGGGDQGETNEGKGGEGSYSNGQLSN